MSFGRHAPGTSRAGFTLVELMVVMIIVGLMSTVAIVSWEALLPNQKFNSAVRQLSEVLHQTRSDAISQNREYRIYYDLENDSYSVRTPFRASGGFATQEDDDEDRLWIRDTPLAEDDIDIVQVTIDDRAYFDADGEVWVRFDPLGGASYHTIVLEQKIFERVHTIEAMPLTGDIRFHDGFFERELVDESDFD